MFALPRCNALESYTSVDPWRNDAVTPMLYRRPLGLEDEPSPPLSFEELPEDESISSAASAGSHGVLKYSMFVFLLLYTYLRTRSSCNSTNGSLPSGSCVSTPPFLSLATSLFISAGIAALYSPPYSPAAALTNAAPADLACASVTALGKNTSVGPCRDVVSCSTVKDDRSRSPFTRPNPSECTD